MPTIALKSLTRGGGTEYVPPDSGGSSIAVPESLSVLFLKFRILFRIEMRILYRYFNKVGSVSRGGRGKWGKADHRGKVNHPP